MEMSGSQGVDSAPLARRGRGTGGLTATAALFLFLCLGAALVRAGELSLPDTTVAPGTVLRLDLRATGLVDVGALTLQVRYDPAVLSFSALESQVAGLVPVFSANDGVISIAWADLTGATPLNVTGGPLLSLEFEVVGAVGASSALAFGADCELAGGNGEPIASVQYTDGLVALVPWAQVALTAGSVSPAVGDTQTLFAFSVTYTNPSGSPPESASVVLVRSDSLSGAPPRLRLPMTPLDLTFTAGSRFTVAQALPAGTYTCYFEFAADGQLLKTAATAGLTVQALPPPPFEVSGRVTLAGRAGGGTIVAFARVSGPGRVPAPVRTGATGAWSASGFEAGTVYRATPRRPEWVFEPASRLFAAAATNLDFRGDVPTGVFAADGAVVPATTLLGNAPNPFNAGTAIRFELRTAGAVRLELFDTAGRLVRVLVDGPLPPGGHAVWWDGTDARGAAVGSGTYIVRLAVHGSAAARPLTLCR
jgi:hypothetical protein